VAPEDAPSPIAALLSALVAPDPHDRTESAEAARREISAISWPDEALARMASIPPSLRPSAPPIADRFAREGHRRKDALLVRDELLVAEDDPRIELALALAEVTHPALPRVFGVEGSALRVELIEGSPDVELDEEARRSLREALAELHRTGVAHGAVRSSLRATRRGVALAFPEAQTGSSIVDDLDALDGATQ
jgi:hypothetical protein